MRFTKMHGLGNDYIYVNCFEETIDDPAGLARLVSDRHKGVGGDGLILIMPSKTADVRMRIFNASSSLPVNDCQSHLPLRIRGPNVLPKL